MNRRAVGAAYEAAAAAYLEKLGYRILERNFRCARGEIDLIAKHDKYLCFIEVKLRKNDTFAPGRAAVDKRKQQKLRTTAEFYLAEHPWEELQPRFDVAELYAPQGMATQSPAFYYWENAF